MKNTNKGQHFKLLNENCVILEGAIRKSVFDPLSRQFAVACREDGVSRFSIIATDTMKETWKGEPLKEDEMAALEGLREGVLVFTVYEDPEDPQLTNILAYDTRKRREAWRRPGAVLTDMQVHPVIRTANGTGPVNVHTGDPEEKILQVANPLLVPNRYEEGSAYFNTVRTFLEDRRQVEAVKAIDYLEEKGSIFISYYLYHDNLLDLYLTLFDSEGITIRQLKLEENLHAPGTEAFALLDDHLYYVRDKKRFCRIKL